MTIIADYRFDDPSSDGTATNSAPRGAPDAAYRGDAHAARGSAVFDGRGDHLVVPPDALLGLEQGTITMSFVQAVAAPGNGPSSNPGAHTLISIDSMNFDGGGHLTIYIRSDGVIEVRHQTDREDYFYRGGKVVPGEPATFSYSWGPKGSTLVLNGVKVAAGNVPLTLAGDVEPVVIGASQSRSGDGVADNLTGFFEGSISRVQITDEPGAGGAFVPCLAGGTRLLTDRGERPVEALRPGDRLVTLDRGPQPVRWIGRCDVGAADLALCPPLRPVIVATRALGNAGPLVLSRQHCVLLPDADGGTLVRAAHLARFAPDAARVREDPRPLSYWHVLLDRHEVIFAEGAPVESLLPGPAARARMPGLAAHLAALSAADRARLARPVRPVADGRAARQRIAGRALFRGREALV